MREATRPCGRPATLWCGSYGYRCSNHGLDLAGLPVNEGPAEPRVCGEPVEPPAADAPARCAKCGLWPDECICDVLRHAKPADEAAGAGASGACGALYSNFHDQPCSLPLGHTGDHAAVDGAARFYPPPAHAALGEVEVLKARFRRACSIAEREHYARAVTSICMDALALALALAERLAAARQGEGSK